MKINKKRKVELFPKYFTKSNIYILYKFLRRFSKIIWCESIHKEHSISSDLVRFEYNSMYFHKNKEIIKQLKKEFKLHFKHFNDIQIVYKSSRVIILDMKNFVKDEYRFFVITDDKYSITENEQSILDNL